MDYVTGITQNGKTWKPRFIQSINIETCIGCGRCYKVCGRGALNLAEKPFEGKDEYGDDMGNMVMAVVNPDDCIGCEACARVCTKRCHVHAPLEAS